MSIQNLFNKWKGSVLMFSLVSLMSCNQTKMVYVDLFKLVNEFELQKEYSAEARKEMEAQKSIIDSIIYVEQLKDKAHADQVKAELTRKYQIKIEERNKEIESLIWKRLNPYLVDFGKEKGYDFIIGANGTGNVLYANEDKNITDELIKYVNERYHDIK